MQKSPASSLALALSLACVLSTALCAEFENCASDSDLADLVDVSVLNCGKNDTVCTLYRNKSVTISIDFESKRRCLRASSKVSGIVAGLEMPFELKRSDACIGTGLTCPLSLGEHTYTYSLFVDKSKPRMRSVIVKWQILNEFNKPIVCVKIPARIR